LLGGGWVTFTGSEAGKVSNLIQGIVQQALFGVRCIFRGGDWFAHPASCPVDPAGAIGQTTQPW